MALTQDHVQGVSGEFKPVIDNAGGTLTANQVQGIFGEFKPVLDAAQTAVSPPVSVTYITSRFPWMS